MTVLRSSITRLANKDDLIAELRCRAEVAERDLAELRRPRQCLPWWLRVFLGDHR